MGFFDDLGDVNWPAFAAIYLICMAIVMMSGFNTMYKIIIAILFLPILYLIMKPKD